MIFQNLRNYWLDNIPSYARRWKLSKKHLFWHYPFRMITQSCLQPTWWTGAGSESKTRATIGSNGPPNVTNSWSKRMANIVQHLPDWWADRDWSRTVCSVPHTQLRSYPFLPAWLALVDWCTPCAPRLECRPVEQTTNIIIITNTKFKLQSHQTQL